MGRPREEAAPTRRHYAVKITVCPGVPGSPGDPGVPGFTQPLKLEHLLVFLSTYEEEILLFVIPGSTLSL